MRRADADAVATLRVDTVREGILVHLGPSAGRAFFAAAASDPHTLGYVSEDEQGVSGFIILTTAALWIERRVLLRHPSMWWRALLAIRSPDVFLRGLRQASFMLRPGRVIAVDPEPRLRLLDVAVATRARGRGTGRALLEAALGEAWRRHHEVVGLSVVDDNVAARRLYAAVGFRVTSRGIRRDGRGYEMMRLERQGSDLTPERIGRQAGPSRG